MSTKLGEEDTLRKKVWKIINLIQANQLFVHYKDLRIKYLGEKSKKITTKKLPEILFYPGKYNPLLLSNIRPGPGSQAGFVLINKKDYIKKRLINNDFCHKSMLKSKMHNLSWKFL